MCIFSLYIVASLALDRTFEMHLRKASAVATPNSAPRPKTVFFSCWQFAWTDDYEPSVGENSGQVAVALIVTVVEIVAVGNMAGPAGILTVSLLLEQQARAASSVPQQKVV